MKIKGRLAKLEQGAGVGVRCLECRVHYIRFGDVINLTAAADRFTLSCVTCRFDRTYICSGLSKRERELMTIAVGTVRTHEEWIAAFIWMNHHPRTLEIKELGRAEEKRLRKVAKDGDTVARKQVKAIDDRKVARESLRTAYEMRREIQGASDLAKEYERPLAVLEWLRWRLKRARVDAGLAQLFILAAMERRFLAGGVLSETRARFAARKVEIAAAEVERLRLEQQYQTEREARALERQRRISGVPLETVAPVVSDVIPDPISPTGITIPPVHSVRIVAPAVSELPPWADRPVVRPVLDDSIHPSMQSGSAIS